LFRVFALYTLAMSADPFGKLMLRLMFASSGRSGRELARFLEDGGRGFGLASGDNRLLSS
jgi:hypothetical protein